MGDPVTWRTLTKAEFDAWHEGYKRDNKFPLRGRNAATGELAPAGVGMTVDLVKPVEVTKDLDVRFEDLWDTKLGREVAQPIYKTDGTVDKFATLAEDVELEKALLLKEGQDLLGADVVEVVR